MRAVKERKERGREEKDGRERRGVGKGNGAVGVG